MTEKTVKIYRFSVNDGIINRMGFDAVEVRRGYIVKIDDEKESDFFFRGVFRTPKDSLLQHSYIDEVLVLNPRDGLYIMYSTNDDIDVYEEKLRAKMDRNINSLQERLNKAKELRKKTFG